MNARATAVVTALFCAILLSACTGPVKTLKPLPENYVNRLMAAEISVRAAGPAAERIAELDARREIPASRADAVAELGVSLPFDELPFDRLIETMIRRSLAGRGHVADRPVRIEVEIDTLKFADAAMTILLGDNDQIAGFIRVKDVESDEVLSEHYIDVIKGSAGLLGLIVRGGGVREKLAAQFVDLGMNELSFKKK